MLSDADDEGQDDTTQNENGWIAYGGGLDMIPGVWCAAWQCGLVVGFGDGD